jgi:tetratricopeptide (TPR) repeat protein
MSFFKNLFGKSDKEKKKTINDERNPNKKDSNVSSAEKEPLVQESNEPETQEVKETNTISSESATKFKKEIEDTFPYYFSTPEMKDIDFTLNAEDGSEMLPHSAFPEQFKQWQGIQSIWDRRTLIYTILDHMYSNRLELWQVIERFTNDRYCHKALDIAKEHGHGEQLTNANYLYALGRAQFHAGMDPEAEKSLEECLNIDKSHKRGRIAIADLYHTSNRHDEAHKIYNAIISENNLGQETKSINFNDFLGFKGLMHSPIYAAGYLEAHPDVTPETWDNIAGEFYYSPYFRTKHAFYLVGLDDGINKLKGLVKLNTLTQEMPWYKEAVVNAYSIIDQLAMQDTLKEDRERLGEIIKQNGWG